MFTQPVSSPPHVGHATSSVVNPPSSSTSRTSRLRGLSYLRNYHLLSRDNSSSQQSTPSSPPAQRPQSRQGGNPLTRSASHSLVSSNPTSPVESSNHLSRVSSHQDPVLSPSTSNLSDHATTESSSDRQVAATATANEGDMLGTVEEVPATRGRSDTATDASAAADAAAEASGSPGNGHEALPSIRLSAYFDPRATRPSLTFAPVARTLPTSNETIRVGRYSERENQPNVPQNSPSAAPVGFKSKVVSRRHCEFFCQDGKWFIKDVKSSSGTFLNHIRLSPPGTESKPFPVNDGDIVQLGIDFKGGEEMIFRCVKMRLELNRGWQSKPNAFNMTAHKRLRNMGSSGNSANNSTSQDCSICLNSIAPCQCLFVAPCSHTWHYKCVQSLLHSPSYPIFTCPNCRMAADLEADIEDLEEEGWEQAEAEGSEKAEEKAESAESADATSATSARSGPPATAAPPGDSRDSDGEPMDVTVNMTAQTSEDGESHLSLVPNSVSQPMPIRRDGPLQVANGTSRDRTPSPPGQSNGHEGPITPRNDAGPWVFDGSAAGSRAGSVSGPVGGMRSLDAATEMEVDN